LGIPLQFFLKPETAKGNQSHPTDANTYYSQGVAFAEQGDYHGALANYEQAIKLDPNDAEVYIGRGRAYSELGEKQKAIDDYNQAIKVNPNNAHAYNSRV
jgi:Flp pilus assembly protein TadD